MSTAATGRPGGDGGLLLLCRANLIRSPMAAALLRARLAERGRADLLVASAGLQVDPGHELPETAVEAAHAQGVDLTDHRPRAAEAAPVREAALVVTMTEEQRAAVERLDRALIPRTFTLPELVRLLRAAAGTGPVESWAAAARAAHRARPLVPPADGAEDVPDPVGRDRRFQQRVAGEIAGLCAELAALVAQPVRDRA